MTSAIQITTRAAAALAINSVRSELERVSACATPRAVTAEEDGDDDDALEFSGALDAEECGPLVGDGSGMIDVDGEWSLPPEDESGILSSTLQPGWFGLA
jgi:hypothetical protein